MILLACWLAHAERLPQDYHAELTDTAADTLSQLARDGRMDDAEAFASRWRRTVGTPSPGDAARLDYELGLGWRLSGDDARALRALDAAVDADPTLTAARYDRGEVRLNRGDVAGAREDFTAVVAQAPTQWPGHFRLADVAARAGDAATFEHELTEALRCGFTFRTIAEDPTWKARFHDPTLGPAMQRLITVYQGDDVFRLFDAPN